MKGTELLIAGLKKEKVDVIFGYPGGVILPLCDHLYDSGIKFILVRHEQGAAHAADGYARASGKVGVCLATSGPGSTNLVTGIATAYMDSIPLVAITGQVATHLIGNDAFQEVDTTGITRPITKHNYLVKEIKELPRIIKEAFHIASTGRPGPVLIDLPVDIQREESDSSYPEKIDMRSYKPVYEGHPLQIDKAWKLIEDSKKPLIIVGGGTIISGASELLKKFIETTSIPYAFTLMGLGAVPVDSPLSLGMIGMHGTMYANYAIMESDLLISVGCRFDDRVTGKLDEFAPSAKIIHIDIDPSAIGKNVNVDVPIVGDAKIIHTTTKHGVIVDRLPRKIFKKERYSVFRVKNLSISQRQYIVDEALKYKNKKLDQLGMFTNVPARLFGFKKPFLRFEKNRLWCSKLIYKSFYAYGIPLVEHEESENITSEDLSRSEVVKKL